MSLRALVWLILAWAGFLLLDGFSVQAASDGDDAVVFRFATIGDSREDTRTVGLDAQDMRWHQATRVLSRLLRDMQAEKVDALFFNGDMVSGYNKDIAFIDREYAFWRGMVATFMETGIYVVPVPGNHEVQMPQPDGSKSAQTFLENNWRDNMGDLILDQARWARYGLGTVSSWSVDNAPSIGSDDGITTDQRQLSFSFDYRGSHYVIINTDPVGHDSHAPTAWMEKDFAEAAKRGVNAYLVFGHKPAYSYELPGKHEVGLEVDPVARDRFWALIEKYGATYFCGHEHTYHAWQPAVTRGGKAWQVLVGSGGSPFEPAALISQNENDRKHVWAKVEVHKSGALKISTFGFDRDLGQTGLIEQWEIPPSQH